MAHRRNCAFFSLVFAAVMLWSPLRTINAASMPHLSNEDMMVAPGVHPAAPPLPPRPPLPPTSASPANHHQRHRQHQHHHRRLQARATDAYDVGGPAPICWKTINRAVTRLSSCPANITLEWLTVPPNPMYAMQDYETDYRFAMNPVGLNHFASDVGGSKHDIPHANVHSCVSTVGFCTPFIGDTPGLATHTAALVGNVTRVATSGDISAVVFDSKVRLNPASYTIIAHIRWFANETAGEARYDMATAMVRDVLPAQNVLLVGKAVEYGMAAVIALACAFLVANLALLVYYRKHKILRFSQVNILIYMTLAGLLALCGVPLAPLTSQLACSLRPWVTIIPLNFMFGLLFGKTWRIFRLMNNKQLKAIKVKESYVLVVAFLLTLPEILIQGIYFLVAPPKVELTSVINEYTFLYKCSGGDFYKNLFDGLHLAYAAMILVLGCYVANKSASLTTLFNEGKYILFAIYTCSILAIIIVPASFAVASDPRTAYILRAMGVALAVAGTIGSINLPKFQLIFSGVEMSLDDNKTSGAAKTSSGTTTSNTTSGAAAGKSSAGGAGAGGGAPSPILVKNHVPTAVMEKMQEALAAAGKVVDRQKQGFALNGVDWQAAVDEVRGLHELLQRCTLTGNAEGGKGGGNKAGGGGGVGGTSAKVAPMASSA